MVNGLEPDRMLEALEDPQRPPVPESVRSFNSLHQVANVVTLWQLLIAICFATPVMGMIASATKEAFSALAWVGAIGTAAIVGLGCALVMWITGRAVFRRVHFYSAAQEAWIFRALYLGGFVWMLIVGAFSVWLSSAMVRLMR